MVKTNFKSQISNLMPSSSQLQFSFSMTLVLALGVALHATAQNAPQEARVRRLEVPTTVAAEPAAGRRVAVRSAEYADSDVHHMLYLPADWDEQWQQHSKSWPLIVEWTGNHFPAAGSSGKVEDARLGYGISGGRCIWLTLPFVSADHRTNARQWWGDEAATVRYAKQTVPQVCAQFGGDPQRVLACGFSRGAIAASYIGLHDDQIAKLWCGLITHDHFDGQRAWSGTAWGTPLQQYRQSAAARLQRLGGRPLLVCQNGGTQAIQNYLQTQIPLDAVTFVDVDTAAILGPFPNGIAIHPHNDGWLLVDSPQRRRVWAWVDRVVSPTPPLSK